MIIKELPAEERPREKMISQGASVVSNAELLAVLIGTGAKNKSALELAQQVLSMNKEGIRHLADCKPEEICSIPGIGLAKACQVIAAIELGKRVATTPREKRISVNNPETIANLFMEEMRYYKRECFKVLMLASLRDYKGVPEFLALAGRVAGHTDIRFDLVLNDGETAIERYFSAIAVPANVTIHPRTADPAAHYARASLVLNLSRPDLWVETFGLTLLEAMAFGVPVIAPPVGGPVELVDEGREGFLIDSRNGDELVDKVLQLADDETLCLQLSEAARSKAARFSPAAFAQALREVVALHAPEKSVA